MEKEEEGGRGEAERERKKSRGRDRGEERSHRSSYLFKRGMGKKGTQAGSGRKVHLPQKK